jgi:N6-L-threonylcarbamoyladenine synthase
LKPLRVLAIESSCDETSLSVLETAAGGCRVLAHRVESQIESHQPFGGVVPEVAARDHLAKIHTLALATLADAGVPLASCTHIAVTTGPGLIGALMVGVLYARGAALAARKPLVAVNHVEAHLAPCFFFEAFSPASHLGARMKAPETTFPALTLTVSGGHCILGRAESPTQRVVLGQTADDACGEAFDKVAKLLGLPYPGGPEIERLAREECSNAPAFTFPSRIADRSNRYGFSFSGLKTSVLDAVRKETGYPPGKASGAGLPLATRIALARAFQDAAVGQLIDRVTNALADDPSYKCLLVAGGVAANSAFRERLALLHLPVRCAPLSLCSDNATMIALQAALVIEAGLAPDGFALQPFPRFALWEQRRAQSPVLAAFPASHLHEEPSTS